MKMRGRIRFIAFLGLLIAAMLAACSATEETRPATAGAPMGTAVAAGMDTCASCHLGMVQEWLQTPHANLNPANPSNLSYAGYPTDAQVDPALNGGDTTCVPCHDPDLNSDTLTYADNDSRHLIAGVTGDGAVFRPVVGCEACHGRGSNHNGAGPIGPYRVSGSTRATALTTAATTINVAAKSTFSITIYATSATTTPTKLSVTAPSTFTRSSGSFITNGFTAGTQITTSGFANVANNGTFTIQSVAATQIVITTSPLVTETGTGAELINAATGAADKFVRPAGSFLTDGFAAGMTITTSGFTNAANNGTFKIKSVVKSTITTTASTLTAETTGGGNELITATNTFVRPAGSFITDGFAAGMVITTSGFTAAANNGTFTILKVTDAPNSTIDITTSTLVAETNVGGQLITSNATTVTSAQFATCTACHELVDAGGVFKAAAYHEAGPPASMTPNNYITDTHFAEAGDFRCDSSRIVDATYKEVINCNDIAGYAMNFSEEKVCSNCHAVHNDGTVINVNREWAASRHADKAWDKAWAHYNWSCDGSNAASCGTSTTTGLPSSRMACQRCHTTTGFVEYIEALQAGNTSLAKSISDGTHQIPNFYTAGFKPERLQCKGCHSDNKGSLRDPGAFKAYYGGNITHQYADLGGSNICMACHTGRKSGDYIDTLTDKFKTGRPVRDVETHYLVAGATIFAATGYEYPNRGYANPTSFKHDKIGTSALAIDGGANGPCVGCHMYRSGARGNHLFRALNVSGGLITGITSDVCFNVTCHPGSNAALVQIAEGEKTKFESALKVFAVQLATAGFKPYTTNNNTDPYIPLSNIVSPYFGTSPDPPGVNVVWDAADDTGNAVGKMNIGAAYNFLLLHGEPGAYVHNGKYAKRLIYDSLDWLDDKQMNYSVGATLPGLTYVNLTAGEKTEAQEYLLPYGSLWSGGVYPAGTGNSAERP